MAAIISRSSQLTHLNIYGVSKEKDKGEGQFVLEALLSSGVLPRLTYFNCGDNWSWFWDDGDSNIDLLCEVIRNMTAAESIELEVSRLNEKQDIKVVKELVALQAINPAL